MSIRNFIGLALVPFLAHCFLEESQIDKRIPPAVGQTKTPPPTPPPATTPIATPIATPLPPDTPAIPPTEPGDKEPEKEPLFDRFSKLVQSRCVSCHNGQVVLSDFSRFQTESAWISSKTYVAPGDPLESRIYNSLKNSEGQSGRKNMPPNLTLSDEELGLVKSWILSLEDKVIAPPPEKPPEGMALRTTSIAPRLGDRFYLAQTLLDIFGPSTEPIVTNNIIKRMDFFGGGCDIYEHSMKNKKLEYPKSECTGTTPDGSQSMSPSTMSEAYRTRSCELIVQTDEAISFALDAIDMSPEDQPDAPSLTRAFRLFYPLQEASTKIVEALTQNSGQQGDASDRWRDIFLALCLSPEWQIP